MTTRDDNHMSIEYAPPPSAGTDRGRMSSEQFPPSDDSTRGLIKQTPKPLEPKYSRATAAESYVAQMDSDVPEEQNMTPVPPRHPSRHHQVMRWEPPASEYGYDDDRRAYGHPMYDYGPRGVPPPPPPPDWYDHMYYNQPYRRRVGSLREPPPSARGPFGPSPPRRPRVAQKWEDPYEQDGYDEPAATHGASGGGGGGREGNPPASLGEGLPFLWWMNSRAKGHFVATLGEFVGTTMFLFFAFAGTQVANAGTQNNQANTTTGQATGFSAIVLEYTALSFGFSLMVNVWVFFRISGGLFNPAVTIGMLMVQSVTFMRAALLIIAQLAGSIFSSFIVKVLFPASFNVRTTLSQKTSLTQGVFIEAILTAELVFTIFMLAKEKHKATFIAPIGIGMAMFVAELVGVYYTGGSLNPARSFGPCVVANGFDPEHWVYWVGPIVGAIAAVGFYKFIKMLEYEVANPGQDETSDAEAQAAAANVATPRKKTSGEAVNGESPKETV